MSSEIRECRTPHHYRTEIPNIIFTLGLDPYEFMLYSYFKKIAGDGGDCFKSMDTIEKETGISKRKIQYCKKKLSQHFWQINRPLITITHRFNTNGSPSSDLIEIVDIWQENATQFYTIKHIKDINKGSALHAGVVAPNKHEGSAPGAVKEDPSQEEPILKKDPLLPSPKKEELRNKLKKKISFEDEEFEEAFKSMMKSDETIYHPVNWMIEVIENSRLKPKKESKEDRTKRHEAEAEHFAKKNRNIISCRSYVEILMGQSEPIIINYDCKEEEWIEKTKRYFVK